MIKTIKTKPLLPGAKSLLRPCDLWSADPSGNDALGRVTM